MGLYRDMRGRSKAAQRVGGNMSPRAGVGVGRSLGAALWQYVAGVLSPVVDPPTFTVVATDATSGTITLRAPDGLGTVNFEAGDSVNVNTTKDFNINLSQDFNLLGDRDLNVTEGRDINLGAGGDINIGAGDALSASGTTIDLDCGSGESHLSMNDSGQMSLFGNDYIIVQGLNETVIGASSPFYDDSVMPNTSLIFVTDEGADVLNVVVKYADGTLMLGGIPLAPV